ncbi:MAG: N-methylhydantoinase [Baekduia sp.]|nr:N-methylhydantoinase [Baekduia sp.]
MTTVKIGVDVGGTFTDVVVYDGELSFGKVSTTPGMPERGVIQGVEKMGIPPEQVDYFVHGSTIALNAILERKGVKTALLTTTGFRDVLEIMRTNRPDLYNLQQDKPLPIVPRHLRFEADGRIGPDGDEVQALDEDQVSGFAAAAAAAGVEAVAVCFINAYANDAHERRAKELIEAALPGVPVTVSSEMVREWREFERTSTAVVNAYVRPLVERYARAISEQFSGTTNSNAVYMMQSNGGLGTEEDVRLRPATTIMSGPVGGVTAAEQLVRTVDHPHLLTLDIGGTSADMCLIHDGSARMVPERDVDRFPILTATVDVHAIGAGGGSIAWLDRGGALRCGPQSAGASPGPACYGRGGTEATVTDAHLVLGHIDADRFLGGEMALDVEAARNAVAPIARALGVSIERAAAAIIVVIDLRMAEALRRLATRAGQDLRDFALVPFGGAGPLHGARLCRELDIPNMVIPVAPGTFSAMGMLMADLRRDYAVTILQAVEAGSQAEIERVFAQLEAEARAASTDERATIVRTADMRYDGQEFSVNAPVPSRVDAGTLDDLSGAFEREHARQYGYSLDDRNVVLVTARISVVSPGGGAGLRELDRPRGTAEAALRGTVKVFDLERDEVRDCPVYDRDALTPGARITGAAIIEEARSTTLIGGGDTVEVDSYGNLLVTIGGVR